MPHATTPAQTQDEIDDDLIRRALNDETQFPAGENIHDRELELGEKADDAVDYADLSDDDLADDDLADDDVVAPHAPTAAPIINTATLAGNIQDLKSTADDENDPVQELDDLFGDGLSPVEEDAVDLPLPFAPANGQNADNIDAEFPFEEVVASQEHAVSPVPPTSHHGAEDESLTQEEKLQRELFAMSRSGLGNADLIPHPPENDEELLLSLWPKFQRDTVPKFMDLLPSKRVRYLGKAPPRQPKALHSNKLELEIAQDEEKSFVLSSGANKRTYEEMERMGIIPMKADATGQQASEAEAEGDSDFENDSVAGVSWHDMQILCGDWDVLSEGSSIGNHERAMEEDPFNGLDWPLSKRRKIDKGGALPFGPSLGLNSSGPKGSTASLKHPQSLQPGVLGNALEASATFHDPEAATARIANKFTIDLNDPYLLIDENAHTSKKRRTLGPREIGSKEQEDLSRRFTQKYNVSNDEAYDLLKENHQHKVRGTLGNVTIEHTLPAIRLQWPFVSFNLLNKLMPLLMFQIFNSTRRNLTNKKLAPSIDPSSKLIVTPPFTSLKFLNTRERKCENRHSVSFLARARSLRLRIIPLVFYLNTPKSTRQCFRTWAWATRSSTITDANRPKITQDPNPSSAILQFCYPKTRVLFPYLVMLTPVN